MKLVDIQNLTLDYSGLVKIDPHNGLEVSRYFANQIMRLPAIDQETLPIVQELKQQLEKATAKNEWISVKDRMPEQNEQVLCYYHYEPKSPDVICQNTYFNNGIWMSETSKVTHWMPLPEPPEEYR